LPEAELGEIERQLTPYAKTRIMMILAYAKKIGIFNHFGEFVMTLLQGKNGLVEATLASCTEASQRFEHKKHLDAGPH
jgi:hypothetical protein